ncbi:glycoside hydrolase family 38 C-terminal domain-containing protein [Devosia rhodophyticola]|uniref:Glycoside hydrolase family 38 C-terminal domain-containing protein n=1 Tax=Devosia rhodophyticola TaxID=3026423 RepID=A0ABY7Z177_9HYPH|nr:alpha-mannosidase [Devosia rhodophyticola]WDR06879.1 glycoside hydrolase family 38 C-terminal domain-containing protein [Devosia rhodophyticola]
MNTPPSHNTPPLHLIGNAHLDPVWLWRWQEGCAEAIGTCWAAIDRLDEGEGFIFTKGEAHIYDWIERFEPSLFARIKHYIAVGRWVVVNGWWIQPDCNVPSGESVIRQALYGKRYFARKFGVEVPTGYNVDSFGHPGTFPMLLQHTGSTSYTFMRPGPHEMDLPAELFTWASPDGSSVAAFRIQGAYNTSKRELPLPEKIDKHQQYIAKSGHAFMCFYGVGNHGGAPTIENITEIEARLARGDNLKFSDPEAFFDAVDTTSLPRVDGELQFHAIGCYAVASALKTLNRRAENLLEQAEAGATIVHRQLGLPYPHEAFETLWRKLLFNQFHDTLGGTSLESACIDSERDLSMVIAGAEDLLNDAVRQLDRTIARPLDPTDATFVVMNFNGTPANGLVEAEPWVDKDNVSRRVLLDETGQSIPFQYIDPHGKTTGLQRIGFALEVPAYGYRVLRFAVDAARGVAAPGVGFGAPSQALRYETSGYALTIDPDTGAIASLTNKQTGIELFSGIGHQAIVVEDNTDTWSHGTDRFGFSGAPMQLVSISTIDSGPVRTTIKLVSAHGKSSLTTLIVLPDDANLPVELRLHLDWHEQRHLLRLAYPLGAERFEYEVAGVGTRAPTMGAKCRASAGCVPSPRPILSVWSMTPNILTPRSTVRFSSPLSVPRSLPTMIPSRSSRARIIAIWIKANRPLPCACSAHLR